METGVVKAIQDASGAEDGAFLRLAELNAMGMLGSSAGAGIADRERIGPLGMNSRSCRASQLSQLIPW